MKREIQGGNTQSLKAAGAPDPLTDSPLPTATICSQINKSSHVLTLNTFPQNVKTFLLLFLKIWCLFNLIKKLSRYRQVCSFSWEVHRVESAWSPRHTPGTRDRGSTAQLHPHKPRSSYFIWLGLSFLICTMGLTAPISRTAVGTTQELLLQTQSAECNTWHVVDN